MLQFMGIPPVVFTFALFAGHCLYKYSIPYIKVQGDFPSPAALRLLPQGLFLRLFCGLKVRKELTVFANNGKIKAKSSVNEKMGILFIIVIIWFE